MELIYCIEAGHILSTIIEAIVLFIVNSVLHLRKLSNCFFLYMHELPYVDASPRLYGYKSDILLII